MLICFLFWSVEITIVSWCTEATPFALQGVAF